MIVKDSIYMLLGGIGLFFFGMQLMSDGMRNFSSEKIKNFLNGATKLPVFGVLIGALVTALIQSSSAATVMTVGFVNAGLLTLERAICVVMGANIGTTVTAWLVSSMSIFKVTSYSLPAIGIGFLLMKAGKKKKTRFLGSVILGFGLLFTGLSFMKDAFAPLKQSEFAINAFALLSGNPLLGLAVGIIFTILLQSSSATIAVVQVLAFNGVIGFEAALPVLLGDNIGTTITAQLASFGTNLSAKRTAVSHLLFNIIGAFYMMVFVYLGWYSAAVRAVVPGPLTLDNVMFHLAIAHTMFNLFNTAVFLPFTKWLEKLSIWLVPLKEGMIEPKIQYLEPHILDTPAVALAQIRREISYMLGLANRSVLCAMEGLFNGNTDSLKKIESLENATDNLQSEITQYIVELSNKELSEDENAQLPVLIHSVNDTERIADHSLNIKDLVEQKIEDKMVFTEDADSDITEMWKTLQKMMTETQDMLKLNLIDKAQKIIHFEEQINTYQKEIKEKHLMRLKQKKCGMEAGIIFVNLIDNLEKVGDHLSNIAEGAVSGMKWVNETHYEN